MTAEAPVVSAVIAAYNAQDHVREAIESVLGQTYPSLECVVVDDGSTDGTAAVVGTFGSRVTFVRQENRGVAAARNAGAAMAKGSAIAFLDADDAWVPEKVALQLPLLDSGGVGLVYGPYWMADENLAPVTLMPAPGSADALRNTLLLEEPSVNIAQTALFSKDAFRAVGGYDQGLSTSADLDLGLRVGARFGMAAVTEPLAFYRRHEAQMSRNVSLQERDMKRVFHKAFQSGSLPPDLQKQKRRAYANLRWILAGGYLQEGSKAQAFRNLSASLILDPIRFAQRAGRRIGRGAG